MSEAQTDTSKQLEACELIINEPIQFFWLEKIRDAISPHCLNLNQAHVYGVIRPTIAQYELPSFACDALT